MNIWVIIIIALAGLFWWNNKRHHFHIEIRRILIILVLFFIALAVVSAYVDMSLFFGKENFFAKTGAAIFSGFRENLDIEQLSNDDTIRSFRDNFVDKASNALDNITLPRETYLIKSAN